MTLRTYLMADFGKGPRCVWHTSHAERAELFGDDPDEEADYSTARRWWLVEAESAEAARDVIEQATCPGRIIDQGSRS